MKLTWFGQTAFRFHIGGRIVVVDAAGATGVDRSEIVSGADHVLDLGDERDAADAMGWKGRARQRLLHADAETRPLLFWSLGPDSLLIEADEDRPLLLSAGALPQLGRWVEQTVVVLAGGDLVRRGLDLAAGARPHLLALAGSEADIEAAFAHLPGALDGTGLLALEHGLAVEV